MLGLTPFGEFHTIISLIAVFAGIIALARDQKITWKNGIGKTYILATVATCITGFFIYHHGGFGKPHVLGIITLIVLALALAGEAASKPFGRLSPYIATVGYSLTFFFHWIPAVTETATRLPAGAPLATGPDDPHIQMAVGVCFLLFLVGATIQVLTLRRRTAVI